MSLEEIDQKIADLQFERACSAGDLDAIRDRFELYEPRDVVQFCRDSPRAVELLFELYSNRDPSIWEPLVETASRDVAKIAAVRADFSGVEIKQVRNVEAVTIFLGKFVGIKISSDAVFELPAPLFLRETFVNTELSKLFLKRKSHPEHFRVILQMFHPRDIALYLCNLHRRTIYDSLIHITEISPELAVSVLGALYSLVP